jgi:hypothetical protein
MDAPPDLETLGRAFLAALVAKLGHGGAAAVLTLLAAELTKGRTPVESGPFLALDS